MSKKNNKTEQDILFSEEEMECVTMNNIPEETNKPVTCLGIEFENDDTRRKFFREELRKKLPELRGIEGFPLGTDDDIINLSDPPYYTACPNPWLNDFVSEWEKEKVQLEAEGKRKPGFLVGEPYASDVSEGKNNPIYNAHSYHTKVPHPAIMRYLLHYTQPGDIVYDGFCGTGMTGVAAQMCATPSNDLKMKILKENEVLGYQKPKWGSRHAILGELSPVASFIAYNYNTPVNAKTFEKEAKAILNQVEKECGWMYETKHSDGSVGKIDYVVWSDVFVCPHCSGEIVFYDAAVDKSTGKVLQEFVCPNCGASHTKKSVTRSFVTVYDKSLEKSIQQAKTVPVLIQYTDKKGKRHEKTPDKQDLALIEKINDADIPYWFPTDLMCEGREAHRNDKDGITHVHHFYTKRALWILSAIKRKLMDNNKILNVFDSIDTFLTSRLTRYNQGKRGNGNLAGTLYVPSLIAESNIFKLFLGKITAFKKAYEQLGDINPTSINSATQISLKDNSVDYIFTDPPFGSNIMYSELNFIQESWLKVKTNNKEEAIENDAQQKSLLEYGSIMQRCFQEYYRVLKPGKWMTVEFSNTAAAVWNAIQQALVQSGFVVASVAALDKQQGSFKAVTSPTAVKQDLVISCYKPSAELARKIEERAGREDNVWDFVHEHLGHLAVHSKKDDKTTAVIERSPKILYDRLVSYYVQKGVAVPIDAHSFQAGLRERYIERDGMFFTAMQVAEYDEKRKLTNGFAPMGIIVSDEANGIEWLKNQLKDSPKTYSQLMPEWMRAISGIRKGDILPELITILEENFIEEADGKWRLPNMQDNVDKNLLRTKALLREFKLYKEQALKPRARLREVRVEALRAGFKQCYIDQDFQTIVAVGDKIPQNLRDEDEILLQFYDIARRKL